MGFITLPNPEFDDPVRLSDDGIAWDDIYLPAFVLGAGASAPDLENFGPSGNVRAPAFAGSGGITEQLYGAFEIPHNYLEGSDLRPHLHWSPTTNDAGNVKWYLEYSVVAAMTGTYGAPTVISLTQAAGGTAWKHNVSEFSAVVSGTGLNIGAMIVFRLYRDPGDVADTYGFDASLLSVGVHYEVDSFGSKNIFTKD